MLVLVDTNVLLRAMEPRHLRHRDAVESLRSIRSTGHEPCLVPQIHYEFLVVATRPVAQNGLGMTPEEADAELINLGTPLFRLLRDERANYDRWRDLVSRYRVEGKSAHDKRLVAAMQRHGISDILTFNVADFRKYVGINPFKPTPDEQATEKDL